MMDHLSPANTKLGPQMRLKEDETYNCWTQMVAPAVMVRLLHHTWSVKRYTAWTRPRPVVKSHYRPDMGLKAFTAQCGNPPHTAAPGNQHPARHLAIFTPRAVHATAIAAFAYRGGLKYRMRPLLPRHLPIHVGYTTHDNIAPLL